ncbi:MAG TPA: GNAT family N-acetyltransferase [Candidatus Obscuribacterales bacterium]
MDDRSRKRIARVRIHSGLPRQAPGSDKTTEETVRRSPALPESARLYRRFSNEYGYEFYLLRKSDIKIRRAIPEDAPQIALLMAKSLRDSLPFLPVIHTAEEDLQYIKSKVLPNNQVFVAHNEQDQIVGFIAFDEEWVNLLYLLPEVMSLGIGSRLLNIAKAQRKRLLLWAFQKNEIARRFYLKHGFTIISETDGAHNEEREPDAQFEWIAPS